MSEVMLITGANKGIGYYMVNKWLEEGNSAMVLDIACDEVDRLKAVYGDKLSTIICDVSNFESVERAVAEAVVKFSKIDIAIHNACVCIFKSLSEHSMEEYKRTHEVNFIGAVNITKAVLPQLYRNKKGRICYTSSGVGVTGFTNISGYSASKGAIEAFAKCMYLEHLGSGVSFHILQPPLTNTESSSPLPVPKEFKAHPKKVGEGLVKNIHKKSFIITPTLFDRISTAMSYRMPLATGKLLVKMTSRANR